MIMYLQFNVSLQGYNRGSVLRIECDSSGIPLDRTWRKIANSSHVDKRTTILATKSQIIYSTPGKSIEKEKREWQQISVVRSRNHKKRTVLAIK
jgi:hypothetical protein